MYKGYCYQYTFQKQPWLTNACSYCDQKKPDALYVTLQKTGSDDWHPANIDIMEKYDGKRPNYFRCNVNKQVKGTEEFKCNPYPESDLHKRFHDSHDNLRQKELEGSVDGISPA